MSKPAVALDAAWLRDHPLPAHQGTVDKNSRGRVLAVGGSRLCPGALRLTGEAALRAGAGKLQMATIADAAMALGVAVPEAAVVALPAGADGELDAAAAPAILELIGRADCIVLGPGMGDRQSAGALVQQVLAAPDDALSLVLDAAAVACAGSHARLIPSHGGRVVLTPHHGEAVALTGEDAAAIAADPERVARATAARFHAIMVLKAAETVIAAPDGRTLRYAGGGVGLATGGSGDVLAGLIGGLLSRGLDPLAAAAWGVWLHGEAGRRLADRVGATGFLARELLPLVPALMRNL